MHPDLPHTWLTRRTRAGIQILLICAFFLTAPFVVLSAAGFEYDRDRREITASGVLSVNTEFSNALPQFGNGASQQITVGDILYTQDPLRVPSLAPGTYSVTIERSGYYPFSVPITIRENQTSYLRDIPLIQNIPPVQLRTQTSTPATLLPGRPLFLSKSQSTTAGVTVFAESLAQPNSYNLTTSSEILPSPFSDWALATREDAVRSTLSLIPLTAEADSNQFSVTGTVQNYQFDFGRDDRVYTQITSTIFALTPTEFIPVATTTAQHWHFDDRGRLWEYSRNTNTLTRKGANEEASIHVRTGSIARIHSITDERAIVQISEREYHVIPRNGQPFTAIRSPHTIRELYMANESATILIAGSDVWRITNTGQTALLGRFGHDVWSALPAPSLLGLFYTNGNDIMFSYMNHPVRYTLTGAESPELIWFDEENRSLYYLSGSEDNRRWFRLDV